MTLAFIADDVLENTFFGIIAAVIVISALKVVSVRNVVHAALYLVLVLAGVAGEFLMLGAEFVGVTQILVYVGAVVVLFLFGIMLTRATLGRDDAVNQSNRLPAFLVSALLLAVMSYAIIDGFEDEELPDGPAVSATTTVEISDSIFADFLIPFEALSVLLLAALVGAIVVARKD